MPTLQKVPQTVLQDVLQAEPEIKYHALSTLILNVKRPRLQFYSVT